MTYKEKLDDKIKALNSTRVFKKITPKFDLSWYIKWVSSLFILIAVSFRSAGGVPFHMFDLYFSFVGTLGWLWVGTKSDRWRFNPAVDANNSTTSTTEF